MLYFTHLSSVHNIRRCETIEIEVALFKLTGNHSKEV